MQHSLNVAPVHVCVVPLDTSATQSYPRQILKGLLSKFGFADYGFRVFKLGEGFGTEGVGV